MCCDIVKGCEIGFCYDVFVCLVLSSVLLLYLIIKELLARARRQECAISPGIHIHNIVKRRPGQCNVEREDDNSRSRLATIPVSFHALYCIYSQHNFFNNHTRIICISVCFQRIMSSSETKDQEEDDKKKLFPFHEMGLDDRILKAIAKLGWINPTLIQERAIPLILEGKDLLARGRTGSGKTGAFCIPLIQRILEVKTNGSSNVNQVFI